MSTIEEQRAKSPNSGRQLLLVDDDDDTRAAIADSLTDLGHAVEALPDGPSALETARSMRFDAVLTDVRMPGMDGIELCKLLAGDHPGLPIVVMTAFGDVESALGALRAGASDFLTKPVTVEGLARALERALDSGGEHPALVRPASASPAARAVDGLVGSSAIMREVAQRIARVPADATVLITGESGTGKEVVARALHRMGPRAAGPFVAVSSAAMPAEILEAELFGHVRGAYTGATEARHGLLREAHGGTLFLDEIGDMPLELQPRLLRALEERRVRPVGSVQEVDFDVRVISATNRNLARAVAEGRFREDLYYRLNALEIELPPLRERGTDVLELARFFLSRASGQTGRNYRFAPEAERQLLAHDWPGNVRELQNCIASAVALAGDGRVGFADLPTAVRTRPARQLRPSPRSLEDVERWHILEVLQAHSWNKARAARTLCIDRTTLYRKLHRYGLSADPE